MIANDELYGADVSAIETALIEPPLAAAATQTIAAFSATSELLTHVGDLAVEYGVGKPLAVFQALLGTYRALISTQAALATTAQNILITAEHLATES